MNKKFYVFLILIVLIIFPFFLQGSERASISPDKLKIEPTESFLPTKDNYVDVRVTFPSEAVHPGGSVTFTLLSSSWPGYAMNAYFQTNPEANFDNDFDNDPRNTAFDMSIIPANQPVVSGASWEPANDDTNTEKLQSITLIFGNDANNLPSSVDLRINSYDYGSIAKLHVKVTYESQTEVENSAMVPIDDDRNYIADYWQKNGFDLSPTPDFIGPPPAMWTGTAKDDLEFGPHANTQKGDGITAVEEYRGSLIGGTHQRTSPLRKDIFLISDSELSMYGYGWADQLPNNFIRHTVIKSDLWNFIDDKDPDTSKNTSLNFLVCEDLHVLTQRAIWAYYSDTNNTDNALGVAKSRLGGSGNMQGPSRIKYIAIRFDEINDAVNETWKNTTNKTYKGNTKEDVFKWTIGHEIGHCLYLPHVLTANRDVTFVWGDDIYDPSTQTYSDRRSSVTLESSAENTIMERKVFIPHPTLQNGKWMSKIRKVGFPDYLDELYQLVPSQITDNDTEVYKTAVMPDFKSWPDTGGLQPSNTPETPETPPGSNQNTQPPNTPTGLSLTPENGQVHLSWTAPSGTVTDYEYRYRESGGSWSDNWISMISSDPDVLTDTEFFVLSLINGTTYEFQLRAVNGEIASAATESSESTPATVPGKPTSLVGDRYNQGVTLRWYPPDDDGGADVTEYQYRYSYTYGTYRSWTTVRGLNNGPNSGPKRSVSIGGLTNGRQYQFQVRAKNSAGYGTESLTIYKTPATTPGAPQNLNAPTGDGEVSLEWDAPSSNGGFKITEYKYSYRESSSDSWDTEGSAGTEQEKTITGLTNSTEYEFRVRAKNSLGLGPWSDSINATPQPPPVWSDIPDPYNLTVGDSFSLDLSSYVTGSPTITWTSGWIPAGLSFSNGVLSGTVTTVESQSIQFTATNSSGSSLSEWVQIDITAATPVITVSAPVWSDIPDPYNLTVGDSFSLDLSSYVTGSPTITRTAGTIPAGLSFSNGVLSGTVTTVESRSLQFTASNSAGSALSEWVQIVVTAASTPTVITPVWSDIPDPYNLTVGDSFSLDLSSYVTGNPTITWTSGWKPVGLSFSNGVLSGTVTTVESRSIQFTATNSAGSAKSEWVQIVVQAAD